MPPAKYYAHGFLPVWVWQDEHVVNTDRGKKGLEETEYSQVVASSQSIDRIMTFLSHEEPCILGRWLYEERPKRI